MTAKPRAKCPECGAKCKRLISAGAGIIFKGSGFYTTDYRSDSYKKAAAKDREAKTATGKKESKADKKD
jgi:predicted nucleic acid-binding Zn ribbon protein